MKNSDLLILLFIISTMLLFCVIIIYVMNKDIKMYRGCLEYLLTSEVVDRNVGFYENWLKESRQNTWLKKKNEALEKKVENMESYFKYLESKKKQVDK